MGGTMADWATVLVWCGVLLLVFCGCGALTEILFAPKPDPLWDDEPVARRTVWDLMDEGGVDGEPSDDEIYNGYGVEGGIAYDTTADQPGSLGENDWRL